MCSETRFLRTMVEVRLLPDEVSQFIEEFTLLHYILLLYKFFYSIQLTSLRVISRIFRLHIYPSPLPRYIIIPSPFLIPIKCLSKIPLHHLPFPQYRLQYLHHKDSVICFILQECSGKLIQHVPNGTKRRRRKPSPPVRYWLQSQFLC